MKVAIHQPQYWPGLRFFSKMRSADLFIYLDDVQFEKREFQNRNRIRSATGWQYLTVPVISKGKFSQEIREVVLDGSADWRREHLEAIRQNYARAEHLRDYLPGLQALYARDYSGLAELSYATIDFIRSALGINTPCRRSSEFGVKAASSARLAQLCKAAGASGYLSGAGARSYLEEAPFKEAGIALAWQDFVVRPYQQVFEGFEKDMSALDLLLNCGPQSVDWL